MSAKSTFTRAKAALNKKELVKGRSMKRIVLKAIKEKLMRVIYPYERAERNTTNWSARERRCKPESKTVMKSLQLVCSCRFITSTFQPQNLLCSPSIDEPIENDLLPEKALPDTSPSDLTKLFFQMKFRQPIRTPLTIKTSNMKFCWSIRKLQAMKSWVMNLRRPMNDLSKMNNWKTVMPLPLRMWLR